MPYVSDAQRRWAHTPAAREAGFPTEEWDRESKGQRHLPERTKRNIQKALKKRGKK